MNIKLKVYLHIPLVCKLGSFCADRTAPVYKCSRLQINSPCSIQGVCCHLSSVFCVDSHIVENLLKILLHSIFFLQLEVLCQTSCCILLTSVSIVLSACCTLCTISLTVVCETLHLNHSTFKTAKSALFKYISQRAQVILLCATPPVTE